MFEFALVALSIIPIMIFMAFGVPVIIGIVVYRDANKRVDCNPWLWAFIAALIPSFVGLVIYAIIRNDYPLKEAGYQNLSMDESDPYSFEQHFDEQGNPIPAKAPRKGIPTWVKVVLILGILGALVAIVGGCAAVISYFRFDPMNLDSFYYSL